ncbi:MAG: hydrolase [Leptospiraceae bacterium]|nr:hydrolase [Leptospiraceae bacterium]
MSANLEYDLNWLNDHAAEMLEHVIRWSNINSGTNHLAGLERICRELQKDFAVLDGEMCTIPLPATLDVDAAGREFQTEYGQALSIRKRMDAPLRVMLCIHMDTVFPADHAFQAVTQIDDDRLHGPGVADARGGLAIMLFALRCLERACESRALELGWEVFINPDEEVGSPGSLVELERRAGEHHLGLLFEPGLPDGSLISTRGGSGNFSLALTGRPAHVGREFERGRSAMHLAARIVNQLASLNEREGITINVGAIDGGGPLNVVSDRAIIRLNARALNAAAQSYIENTLADTCTEVNAMDGHTARLYGRFTSPPKEADDALRRLMRIVEDCAGAENIPIQWRSSGGVCDGNKLMAAGLPNIDTLGARGGNIHSDQEYMIIPSLLERARLVARILIGLAEGSIAWPITKPENA